MAETYGCHFLDVSSVVTASGVDGIEMDADNHRKLAAAVRANVKGILV